MTEIKKYFPNFFPKDNLFVVSYCYDKDKNLDIRLVNGNNHNQIVCSFNEVVSFFIADEGIVYSEESDHKEIMMGCYRLKGSNYLDHYNGQNYLIDNICSANHYLVVTSGEVFSILSSNEPDITLVVK